MADDAEESERRRMNDAAHEMVNEMAVACSPIVTRIWKDRQLTDREANMAIAIAHMQVAATVFTGIYGMELEPFWKRLNQFLKEEVQTAPLQERHDDRRN